MINFDNAATTFPKPLSVRRAAAEAIKSFGGNAGRGGHELAMRTSEALYSARETAAAFFGAAPENTVFTLNCTHALNMAIQGVMSEGGHIIISSMEHNSAARPAVALAMKKQVTLSVAEVFPDSERTLESFRRLIRSDTRAVICTIASNVTGQLLPYKEIGQLCRENGICFIADGAQACGIYDIKLSDGINRRSQGTLRNYGHRTAHHRRTVPHNAHNAGRHGKQFTESFSAVYPPRQP